MISMIKNNCPTLVSNLGKHKWQILRCVQVQYYGVYFDQGLIHLVMEYMDGGSLETMISVEK